ncbi:MAG: hypothetical protein OXG99_09760 [Alphaproteobacteria bacterium]|nr:hypothetical protein [Alphaproteobacteria bacterium]
MKVRQSILGLLTFAAIMVVAGAAYASCSSSNRLTFHHSECLHGWWDNNDWPKKSTFGAQMMEHCVGWGKVVAKVDLASCTDKTWHLTNTNKRKGSEACRVRGIYCCTDISDLCNKSDLMSIESCTSQWNKSPASNSCELSGGETYTSGSTSPTPVTWSDENCNFWAKCQYVKPDWTLGEKQASIKDVHWPEADEVYNCNGVLKEGGSSC